MRTAPASATSGACWTSSHEPRRNHCVSATVPRPVAFGGDSLDDLVLKQSDVFLRLHERALERTGGEAKAVAGLLQKHGLPDGGTILDAPCGIGRHAIHLAGMGFHVSGIDTSARFIERANEFAWKLGLQDRLALKVGDPRTVRDSFPRQTFDAAICMWQSLGHWDEATDLSILKQFRELTAARGVLVVDLLNRDHLVKHMTPFGLTRFEDGTELHETRRLNYESSHLEMIWEFYRREGEDLKHRTTAKVRVRLYALHELRDLLLRAGWSPLEEFGSFASDPVTFETTRLIAVASKA